MREDLVEALSDAGVAWSDAGKGDLSKSINVLSAEQAKGLEFDAVVLIEPEAIVEESESGLRLLYVALTRSTRFLTVAYSGLLIPSKGHRSSGAPSVVPTRIRAMPATRPQTSRRICSMKPLRPHSLLFSRPLAEVEGRRQRTPCSMSWSSPVVQRSRAMHRRRHHSRRQLFQQAASSRQI